MFCPKCGVEHRPGFKRCTDCGVDLVPTLPAHAKAPGKSADHRSPVAVWRGDDPVAFSAALAALEEAGVPTRQLTFHDQWARIAAIQPSELEILVHPDNAERARDIIREAFKPEPPDSAGQ